MLNGHRRGRSAGYGTGQVPQTTMMRCGLVLNLVGIGAVAAAAFLAFG
ncbi:MAG: hypothetical protein Q7U99_15385 [Rubrivivax sp.]|nr:hypothetical protein [Rubrivivax sp.]